MPMDPAIPSLDLTGDPETLRRGSEQWGIAARWIKGALGAHGFFLVKYEAVTGDDRARLCEAMHGAFDLPVETKTRCSNPDRSFSPYMGKGPKTPLFESLRVPDPAQIENAEAVARLLWPDGNDGFCKAVHTVGSKMTDLTRVLAGMILDGHGLGIHIEAFLETSEEASFRLIKYTAPEEEGQAVGLQAHADPGYLTVLGQNDVPGLTIRNNQGDWVGVDPGQGYFVVFVAQSLRAFTNGRIDAPFHQVGMSGAKDRLSYSLFLNPKPDAIVEATPEMVNEEHPPLFRPYLYRELTGAYRNGAGTSDVLRMVAGL